MWTEADRELSFARIGTGISALPMAQALPWGQHLRLSVASKGFGYLWVDHHGNGRLALSCKAAPGEQQSLVTTDPMRYFVPEYDGVHGWVGAHLDPAHDPDWPEICALLHQAWRLTAPKAIVRAHDSALHRGSNPAPAVAGG